jgi:superfamily II DNA or RNA helicase
LADHVGLGKTIQAALIVAELRARRLAERVLVITPPSLREQWATELRDRFALSPTIFDHASLTATVRMLPAGVNPWQTTPLIVSSIDLVKRPEVRTAIDGVAFDLLIVDEAHHVTPGTDRGTLVADIASRTPWVVLISATPHSGDDAAFAYLQRLGSARVEPFLAFRRCRPSATPRMARRSRLFIVTPTSAERLLLEATTGYVRAVRHATRRRDGASLVAAVIARRASSSAEAARRTLLRRAALLAREAVPEMQPFLPWEDGCADAELDDAALATAGLADVRREVEWLERMAALASSASAHWSKLAVIHRLLTRTSEQLLVFTEYRDVAEHLSSSLGTIASVAALHGGLSRHDRRAAVDSFNRGLVRVLVATDAAGEGLNLQHRCRCVINLELPWSPRRLEQRIGRVDRLGQTRRVHAMHLVHARSFEGTVVARLERRRAAAAARTAELSITERDTAAGLQRQLRLVTHGVSTERTRCSVYAAQRLARRSSVVLVYSADVLDGSARIVQRLVAALTIAVRSGPSQPRVLTRPLLRLLTRDRRVRVAIADQFSRQMAGLPSAMQRVAGALDERLSACLSALDHDGGAAWQGSLFDARADHAGRLAASACAERRAHTVRLRQSMAGLHSLRATEPRLTAAWLG